MTRKLMTMAIAVAVALGAWADTETVDGYTWTYSSYWENEVEIVRVSTPIGAEAVTIPSTLGGLPVTTIGEFAFSWCTQLKSVTIPDSVIYISHDAFYGTKLSTVHVARGYADHVKWMISVSGYDIFKITFVEDLEPSFANLDPEPVVVNYGGKVEDVLFSKAKTATGALYDAKGNCVGTVELKFGKKGKKGVKLSASATMTGDGKSKRISAKAVTLGDGETRKTLTFKDPIGEMSFAMGPDGTFTLKNAKYEMAGLKEVGGTVQEVKVGGSLPDGALRFCLGYGPMPDFGKDGVLLKAALPIIELVHVKGGKWSFDKVSTPKYKKNRETGAYELFGLDDPAKPNVSGLKLSYTAKTGIFKGSFKLYVTNEATAPNGKAPKLKKFTVNVIGFVVDGKGNGEASLKKPAASWNVTVR